jgi:hypothetical protein
MAIAEPRAEPGIAVSAAADDEQLSDDRVLRAVRPIYREVCRWVHHALLDLRHEPELPPVSDDARNALKELQQAETGRGVADRASRYFLCPYLKLPLTQKGRLQLCVMECGCVLSGIVSELCSRLHACYWCAVHKHSTRKGLAALDCHAVALPRLSQVRGSSSDIDRAVNIRNIQKDELSEEHEWRFLAGGNTFWVYSAIWRDLDVVVKKRMLSPGDLSKSKQALRVHLLDTICMEVC